MVGILACDVQNIISLVCQAFVSPHPQVISLVEEYLVCQSIKSVSLVVLRCVSVDRCSYRG